MENPTKVVLKNVRLSFSNIDKPRKQKNGGMKYSASLIIDPEHKDGPANLKKLKKAINAAKELGISEKWGGKLPKSYESPLKDGNERDNEDEAYADKFYINTTSKHQPTRIYKGEETDEDGLFESGYYAHASVNLYPFSVDGNKGVACGINGVMFVKKGEKLSSGGNVMADFAEFFDDDDDDEDDEDEAPKKSAKKKRPADDDDEDEAPKKKKRKPVDDDDEDEDDEPRKKPAKKKRPADDDDDDEPAPKKKKKREYTDDDDDEDEEPPRKKKPAAPAKKKKRPADDDDEDDDLPF